VEPTSQSSARLRFGSFEADLRAGVLTRQGVRLPLQDLPFRALTVLLQNPGTLITREDLRQQLWPQTVVDFDHGLNKAINKIRDALGDSASHPRFIETVARRGYRFLADVTVIAPDLPTTQGVAQEPVAPIPVVAPIPEQTPVPPASPGRSDKRTRGIAAIAVSLLLVVAAIAWQMHANRQQITPVRSLAVLPLENLSGNAAEDYFADGMTDELITQLAQIGQLRIISRTSVMSYKNLHKPLAEVANELKVQAIVEGSVVTSGSRVRISAQLIQVPDDIHIWASSYEGDLSETLKLQGEVARDIAAQVRVTLSPHEQTALRLARAVVPAAYQAYLKGRYFWNKRTALGLKTAIEYFDEAVSADPGYAEAYAGLADSYALAGDWEYGVMSPEEAWPLAASAARHALALDDGLGAAHASLGFSLDLYAWDWPAADIQFQRAIALGPNYATAHHWYGFHLLLTGRDREAIEELRQAEDLDPLSLIISADIADALCIAHQYDQSIEQSRRTLAMEPQFALGHYELGQALEQKLQYDQAADQFRQAIDLGGHSAVFDAHLAHVYAVSDRKQDALRILRALETQHAQDPAAFPNIALVYVGLGDANAAFTWLEKAYAARVNPSILLRPAFDPIRADPRFHSLLIRMELEPGKKTGAA
jgi:TolB-like protein/DNA-binding winged helix-turn-helix (wHTH) protein/Flp pilus assembly protein TadD